MTLIIQHLVGERTCKEVYGFTFGVNVFSPLSRLQLLQHLMGSCLSLCWTGDQHTMVVGGL